MDKLFLHALYIGIRDYLSIPKIQSIYAGINVNPY